MTAGEIIRMFEKYSPEVEFKGNFDFVRGIYTIRVLGMDESGESKNE